MKVPLFGKNGNGQFALIDDEDAGVVLWYRWNKHTKGYATVSDGGETLIMHRLIMGAPDGALVDHINMDRLDNRKANLRLCTFQQNLGNSKPRHGKKYKGVYFEKTGKPKCWHAKATHNSKQISFGRYRTELEAAHAYDKNIKQLRGEFAWLNFPANA